jgi:hypothetical protein
VEHAVERAGEVLQEGVSQAEEGVNWLVHEAQQVINAVNGHLKAFVIFKYGR